MKTYQKFVNENIYLSVKQELNIKDLSKNIILYKGTTEVINELINKYKYDIINMSISLTAYEIVEVLRYVSDNCCDKVIPFRTMSGAIVLLFTDKKLDITNQKEVLDYYNSSVKGKEKDEYKYNQIVIYSGSELIYKPKSLRLSFSIFNDSRDIQHFDTTSHDIKDIKNINVVINLFQKIIRNVIENNTSLLAYDHIIKLIEDIGLTGELRQKYSDIFKMKDWG